MKSILATPAAQTRQSLKLFFVSHFLANELRTPFNCLTDEGG